MGSNIVHKTQAASLKALSRKAPRFTKHQICYSIKFPLAEERWNKLELLEYSLLQHPLALFPHLEKCVDPKVKMSFLFNSSFSPQFQQKKNTMIYYYFCLNSFVYIGIFKLIKF